MTCSKTAIRPAKARAATVLAAAALALTAALATPGAARAEDRVRVEVDRAQLMQIDETASAVIVGNPMIADATVHDKDMLIITGKSFGSTNLIVLDQDGKQVMNRTLEVHERSDAVLTMHKGAARMSYSCSPNCEPTLLSGDAPEYFNSVRERVSGRNEAAAGAAAR